MQIHNLGKIPSNLLPHVGGKARGLDKLVKCGYKVPEGFVVVDLNLDNENELNIAFEFYNNSGLDTVAVRSSASVEDGSEFSYAGQFVTKLGVDKDNFIDALKECVNSLQSITATSYSENLAKENKKTSMTVVIQKMLEPSVAGVLFTESPTDNSKMLIEAVEGLGEALVSGQASAQRYEIEINSIETNASSHTVGAASVANSYKENNFTQINNNNTLLSARQLYTLCIDALKLQNNFGTPLDLEWASDGVDIYWLQARPITTTASTATVGDDFDPNFDLTGHIITRCNIGEMLPEAVTPLSISVSLFAIDWGMRKMIAIAGANKKMKELPNYSCALSVQGHLFLNLTPLYRMTQVVAGTSKKNIDFSICGRILSEQTNNADMLYHKNVAKKHSNFFRRINNLRRYFNFLLSRKKAMKKLQVLSDTLKLDTSIKDAKTLYSLIDNAKSTADTALMLHYVTSSHSGAMSSAFYYTADSKLKDGEKSKALLAEVLEGIDGIESADILANLRKVGQAVLADNPNAKNYSTDELLNYLKSAPQEVQNAKNAFLLRHGHRCIREAELRSKGWSEDEKGLTEFLKTVIVGGVETTPPPNAPDIKTIIKEYGLKGTKRGALVYLAKQAREGVKNREYSKSKMILILHEFKKAYSALSDLLVNSGILPDSDLIYFFSHNEIAVLVGENKEEKNQLVKRAISRRRLLPAQNNLRFNEVYVGKPEPLPPPEIKEGENTLKGTAISRGFAKGKARIVRNLEDAKKIEKGEIMVAVYTDIGWSPYYGLIEGLVTEIGSSLSHGAVVAREYSLPFVSNISGATGLIKTGDVISIDGSTGVVEIIKNEIVYLNI